MTNEIYLLLGANLGSRFAKMKEAQEKMSLYNIDIQDVSSVYETEPWGLKNQPSFLNMAVKVHFSGSAFELLHILKEMEIVLGREKSEVWGPRIIDIDILDFKGEVINDVNLKLPHPRLQERLFALKPLKELNSNWIHPILNVTVEEMTASLDEQLGVTIFCDKNFCSLHVIVSGKVQRVYYRNTIADCAVTRNVFGFVRNLEDGSVEIEVEGDEVNVKKFMEDVWKGSVSSEVHEVKVKTKEPVFYKEFVVRRS